MLCLVVGSEREIRNVDLTPALQCGYDVGRAHSRDRTRWHALQQRFKALTERRRFTQSDIEDHVRSMYSEYKYFPLQIWMAR